MKSLRTLVSIAVLGTIIALSGCGGGKGNTEPVSDKQLGLLSKTWKPGTVTQGGVDVTADWSAFKLTISGTKGQSTFSYSCAGRPAVSPWKSAGSFQFGTDPTKTIIRDDQTSVSATTYSVDPASANLSMRFSFSGTGYSRVSNVSGDWVFNLIPN